MTVSSFISEKERAYRITSVFPHGLFIQLAIPEKGSSLSIYSIWFSVSINQYLTGIKYNDLNVRVSL